MNAGLSGHGSVPMSCLAASMGASSGNQYDNVTRDTRTKKFMQAVRSKTQEMQRS